MAKMQLNAHDDNQTHKPPPKGYGKRLDAVRIQLRSQLPSDIWRGIEQVQRWLSEDPEDREIYGLLLNVVKENPELHQRIHDLFQLMIHNGSKTAANVLHFLPHRAQDLVAAADDAYYASEHSKAIQLYQMVLQMEPNNQRAQNQLEKIRANEPAEKPNRAIPREALQWFNQAQSCIVAKDITTAIVYLNAAVEEAKMRTANFPEAERLLKKMQEYSEKRESANFNYDVFISYSHCDEDFVQNQLLTYLESQSVKVCVDYRDFKPGIPSLKEMERAVVESRKTLLVITPDYINSEWAEFENLLAQTLDPAARKSRMIPIILKLSDLPARLSMLTYLDCTHPNRVDIQFDRLVRSIKLDG